MKINPEIFKAYDIRGIYPEEINEEVVYNIGRALVEYLNSKKIVIGRDIRNSSDELSEALIKGIAEGGADVIDIGIATTPMIYYASGKLEVNAGVIITASHNPAEYNGMKLCLKGAVPIGEGSGMEEIKELALRGDFSKVEKQGEVIENNSLKEDYKNYLTGFYKKGLGQNKIVIDFANAMGIEEKDVLEKFSEDLDLTYLYDNFDGNFPNHEANPLKTETLEDLQKKVLEVQADLGIAYDGDADRVGFVDEKGEVVPMDYVTALISKEILKKNPGELILIDLRSSNAVREVIEEAGGKVKHCRVGHSLIKAQMRRDGAIFAGELSGHYFFEENFKAEMTVLAVIMILNLLNETGKTMSELTADLKRYYHSGEINSDVQDPQKVFDELKKKYSSGKINELDGIRIDFEDWWFNVRASNTEPKIRLNLEAKSKELMEEKKIEVLNIVRSY
jgi:phosphomannomutase